MSNNRPNNRKKVLCPMESQGRTRWMRIGSAFINADGSTNVYLDAYPANGRLQIRDFDEEDRHPRPPGNSANPVEQDIPF